jgi:hypothetical protein
LVYIIIVFVVVYGLGASNIDLNNIKKFVGTISFSIYFTVIFPCQCYSANAAYSYFIHAPLPLRQLSNRWRHLITPLFHAKKNPTIEVIIGPLLFTKIIGVFVRGTRNPKAEYTAKIQF